jgi:uncharacterized protein with FMN-binding domain
MKRALLIAGGTVGGLGAVLSITPPQLNSQGAMGGLSTMTTAAATTAAPVAQTTTVAPATTTPVATTPSATATTPKATTAKKKKVTKKKVALAKTSTKTTTTSTSNSSAAATPTTAATTPAPAKSTAPAPAPATKKVSGTFTGSVVNVNYGNVQVQITVVDGKITDAQALQAPTGRSDRYTQYALPILRSQTLAAQGSNIQGASGASYTSYGWYTSLQSALAKAGL